MRVLMISKACVTGIYQRKLEEIARLGIDLTVVVSSGWRDECGWLPLERTYVQGYRLLVTPMRFNGSFHLHYYPRLPQILAQIKPDIVHIDEEPYNLTTWHATRLAKRIGAKTVFFTWQNLNRRYPPPFGWWEQYTYRQTNYAIAGNRDAAQVMRAKGYTGPIEIIPQFGVDPALYGTPCAPNDEPFTIGYVGRLVPEKGVSDLLEAAAHLRSAPVEWRVRLLGNGPDLERLTSLAQSLGIEERVQLDSHIPSHQVPAYMSRLHALVLPSRTRPNWKEQFGRVLIEAMVTGVPVIGSDSGEIPNVIGKAGLVFPEGDVKALSRHLRTLIDNPTLWADLSKRGQKRVLAHFTQAQIAAETVAVYRKLLSIS